MLDYQLQGLRNSENEYTPHTLIVGTKSDIQSEETLKLISKSKSSFSDAITLETSSLINENVSKIFLSLLD